MSESSNTGMSRDEDLRAWPTGDAPDLREPDHGNWLAFEVEGQVCAVDSRQIRSVLRPLGITPLPGRNAYCPGLLAWQSQALVVLDLGACLGLRPSLGQTASRLLVCHGDGHAWGLLVDGVRGFQRITTPEPGWIAVRPGLRPPWNAMFALLPLTSYADGQVCAMLHLQTLWEGCMAIMPSGAVSPGEASNHHAKDSP